MALHVPTLPPAASMACPTWTPWTRGRGGASRGWTTWWEGEGSGWEVGGRGLSVCQPLPGPHPSPSNPAAAALPTSRPPHPAPSPLLHPSTPFASSDLQRHLARVPCPRPCGLHLLLCRIPGRLCGGAQRHGHPFLHAHTRTHVLQQIPARQEGSEGGIGFNSRMLLMGTLRATPLRDALGHYFPPQIPSQTLKGVRAAQRPGARDAGWQGRCGLAPARPRL